MNEEAEERWILWRWFYDSSEKEAGLYVSGCLSCYQQRRSIWKQRRRQTLPCFSSGEYKSYTVLALSLWCPLGSVVSCELLPGETRAGCWQPMKGKAGWAVPVHLIYRDHRQHGPRPDGAGWQGVEGSQSNHSGLWLSLILEVSSVSWRPERQWVKALKTSTHNRLLM